MKEEIEKYEGRKQPGSAYGYVTPPPDAPITQIVRADAEARRN